MNMMERTPETRPFGQRNNLGGGIGLIAIGTLLVLEGVWKPFYALTALISLLATALFLRV